MNKWHIFQQKVVQHALMDFYFLETLVEVSCASCVNIYFVTYFNIFAAIFRELNSISSLAILLLM